MAPRASEPPVTVLEDDPTSPYPTNHSHSKNLVRATDRLRIKSHDYKYRPCAGVVNDILLRIGPVEIDRAEAVSDTDRVFIGISTGSFGEDHVYELANAADARSAVRRRAWNAGHSDDSFGFEPSCGFSWTLSRRKTGARYRG
jgi:hypothetical protein